MMRDRTETALFAALVLVTLLQVGLTLWMVL